VKGPPSKQVENLAQDPALSRFFIDAKATRADNRAQLFGILPSQVGAPDLATKKKAMVRTILLEPSGTQGAARSRSTHHPLFEATWIRRTTHLSFSSAPPRGPRPEHDRWIRCNWPNPTNPNNEHAQRRYLAHGPKPTWPADQRIGTDTEATTGNASRHIGRAFLGKNTAQPGVWFSVYVETAVESGG